jgi:hypothetical protein
MANGKEKPNAEDAEDAEGNSKLTRGFTRMADGRGYSG